MTRKTEESYYHLFDYIEKNVCSLNCKSFMTDFERAMRNALKSLYKDSAFNTCWFHLCQAARRQVAKKGVLAALIQRDEVARELYKKVLAIPLLPAEFIKDAFLVLKGEILTRFSREFLDFMLYFERQWIENVSPNASIQIW